MGLKRVTPRPLRYADAAAWQNISVADAFWQGRFYLRLPLTKGKNSVGMRLNAQTRREAAQLIARATGTKAVFDRPTSRYHVGGWTVSDWATNTAKFLPEEREVVLAAVDALAHAGYELADILHLHWILPGNDRACVLKVAEQAERSSGFLQQLLRVQEEMRVTIYPDSLAFELVPERFSAQALNRVLYVVSGMIAEAMAPENSQLRLAASKAVLTSPQLSAAEG